jgi:hypothetical protein
MLYFAIELNENWHLRRLSLFKQKLEYQRGEICEKDNVSNLDSKKQCSKSATGILYFVVRTGVMDGHFVKYSL